MLLLSLGQFFFFYLILTKSPFFVETVDLLNPNFDKNLGNVWIYQNLGLKGQKLSKFVKKPSQIINYIEISTLETHSFDKKWTLCQNKVKKKLP